MANRRRNALVVPGADAYIEQFKNEIAAEYGIANYDKIDKGSLPARVHGMIGGTMTKRLIEMGQLALSGQNVAQSNLDLKSYAEDMQREVGNNITEAFASAPIVPLPEQSINNSQNIH